MTTASPAPTPNFGPAEVRVLLDRLKLYREFVADLDRTDHPTPLDLALAYGLGRTKLQNGLRELAVVPTPAEASSGTTAEPADAPPTVDPAVAARYRPPYQPQRLQLHLDVRVDADRIWVEVPELPGLFATGETIPQLGAALGEAVEAYLLEHTTVVRRDGGSTAAPTDAPTDAPTEE